ncbi:MAG: hypothetical protein JW741_25655 [Sedimentisphaerales bacterium]|nr:hypothetical protein [Sedimentisphaerales bacterium]
METTGGMRTRHAQAASHFPNPKNTFLISRTGGETANLREIGIIIYCLLQMARVFLLNVGKFAAFPRRAPFRRGIDTGDGQISGYFQNT